MKGMQGTVFRTFLLLGFLLFWVLEFSSPTEGRGCLERLQTLSQTEEVATIDRLLSERRPIVVAHGKNYNISEESTWQNYEHSIREGADVLEFDVWITRDGIPIVLHDPTFHRIAKDYRTPQEAIDAFIQNKPELARRKQADWDFLLFDRVSSHTLRDIQDHIKVFDGHSGNQYEVITLAQMLDAIRTPTLFQRPPYRYVARGPPSDERVLPARTILLDRSIYYYIDFKDANFIGRVIENQSIWDWERASWSYGDLYDFTARAIEGLVKTLETHQGVEKCLVVARHPLIVKMIQRLNPRVRILASTDLVGPDASPDAVVAEMKKFAVYRPALFEIKYLKHILSPNVRLAASRLGFKLFYDMIAQTDPKQFEGPYRDNLPKLLDDILRLGDDILIQTNTVREVRTYLDRRYPFLKP